MTSFVAKLHMYFSTFSDIIAIHFGGAGETRMHKAGRSDLRLTMTRAYKANAKQLLTISRLNTNFYPRFSPKLPRAPQNYPARGLTLSLGGLSQEILRLGEFWGRI